MESREESIPLALQPLSFTASSFLFTLYSLLPPMAHESSNDLNTPVILVVGLVSSVATFAIILYLIGLYHTVKQRQEGRQSNITYADPEVVVNRQLQTLREPAMIDAGSGQVRLPIDVAMTQVVTSLKNDRSKDPVMSSPFVASTAVAAESMDATEETAAEDRAEDAENTETPADGEAEAGATGGSDGETGSTIAP